jgi:aminoglycoside 3-N-acetyltransferase I
MPEIYARKLTRNDRDLGKQLFRLMADVFAEESVELGDDYVDNLLARPNFWVIAAFLDGLVVGGLTAHLLPMTRTESAEIFIYDIAVREEHQRKGVGRRLMLALREKADAHGVQDIFVPADDGDTHAVAFYRALGGTPSSVTLFTF